MRFRGWTRRHLLRLRRVFWCRMCALYEKKELNEKNEKNELYVLYGL